MCMFCAAVPVAGAVGAQMNSKQRSARLDAEERGVEPPKQKPVAKVTLTVIAALVVCSVLYHVWIYPRIFI